MRTVFASRDPLALARASEGLARQAFAIARTRGSAFRAAAGADLDDWAIVGEPARVADRIARYREAFGMTHLVVRAQIPGVERAELEGSLEVLAGLYA
jgi:alkanesulfonate monooxygenase SsuD/methylene tetrahydromethanopterin reductase-like flavin-dependent oxidoreductase (luciferase family)